jgi:hypothetical protein
MKRLVVASAVTVVCLVAGTHLLQSRWVTPPVAASQPDRDDARIRQLEAELRQLRSTVASLKHATTAQPSAAVHIPALPPAADEPGEQPTPSASELSLAQANAVEQQLRTESLDTRWAHGAARNIDAALGKIQLAGFRAKAAECRSTVCRVHVDRGTELDIAALSHQVAENPELEMMPKFFHYEPDQITIYMAKQGHELPTGL